MIGWVYESNRTKTKQAQEDLDEFYLKDSITDLQNAKDAELKLLDERIKNWDDYLRMLQTRYEEFDRLQEQKLLMELTGAKSQEEIYAIISGDMTNFIEYMDNNLDKFFDNQIEAFSNFNTTFSDFLETYKKNDADAFLKEDKPAEDQPKPDDKPKPQFSGKSNNVETQPGTETEHSSSSITFF